MGGFWGEERKDLQPPCVGCNDRKQLCQDHCSKSEYLEYKEQKRKRQETAWHNYAVQDYERHAIRRRQRGRMKP